MKASSLRLLRCMEALWRVPWVGAPTPVLYEGLSSIAGPQAFVGQAQPQFTRGGRRKQKRNEFTWARDYDACIDCGTTERPHVAHGRCKRCDDRWRVCIKD